MAHPGIQQLPGVQVKFAARLQRPLLAGMQKRPRGLTAGIHPVWLEFPMLLQSISFWELLHTRCVPALHTQRPHRQPCELLPGFIVFICFV